MKHLKKRVLPFLRTQILISVMKNLILICCAFLGVCVASSCSCKTANCENEKDSVVVVDSDSIAPVDTVEVDSMICPD